MTTKPIKKRKSAALIMGVLISSIIMVVVVTLATDALHALTSGQNIADSEVARQAAETGLENALLQFKGVAAVVSDADLIANYYSPSGITITRKIMNSTPTEPSETTTQFLRRDMNEVAIPGWCTCGTTGCPDQGPQENPTCDHWQFLADINTKPYAYHQFWNFKVYRTNPTPLTGAQQTKFFGPIINSNDGAVFTVSAPTVNSPGSTLYNIDAKGNYSYRFNLDPSLQISDDQPISVPSTMRLRYWVWADDYSSVQTMTDPATNDIVPKVYGTRSRPIKNGVKKTLDWQDVADGAPMDFQGYAVSGCKDYCPYYFHFYYVLKPAAGSLVFANPADDSLSMTANVFLSKKGYQFPDTSYFIDAVGMYGNENVKIQAIFDPENKKVWRLNNY